MKHALTAILLLSITSCTTSYLWERTDPYEYVVMDQRQVTEDTLKSKHLKYYRRDECAVFLVEKSRLQKLQAYSIRAFGTPITIAIDTATAVLVVGAAIAPGSGSLDGHGLISGTEDMYESLFEKLDKVGNTCPNKSLEAIADPESAQPQR